MLAHTKIVFWIISICSALSLKANDYTLDFSNGDSVEAVTQAKIELTDAGFDYLFALPPGTYELLLDQGNKFVIPVDRGEIRLEQGSEDEVRKIVLYTRALSIEEGYALAEVFHEKLNLPLEEFYSWAEPTKEYKYPRDFYGNGIRDNYPEISMSVHSAFNKDIPFFITYHFAWDNRVSQRRGTSPETNDLKNFTFDVPAILESVRSKAVKPSPIEEAQQTDKATEAEQASYKEKKPVEVVFDEVSTPEPDKKTESVEKSSNLWLWLIGVVAILGVASVVVRKKS